jgi:hypothetical protein
MKETGQSKETHHKYCFFCTGFLCVLGVYRKSVSSFSGDIALLIVSFINKADVYYITEMLMKVSLNTHNSCPIL